MAAQRVGHFKLTKTLGIGTFCRVRLGLHDITGEKVAVKIFEKQKLARMNMGEKIKTEVQFLRRLKHPHIVRLYDVVETPSEIYLIIEFVSNGELFDYIVSNGRLDENEARRLFQQLICAVEYCHEQRVVHRDLKPENLLLDADNRIKLADFGLSNEMRDGHFLYTSCGSPNYAAPEVISGASYAGPEVDIWSCGVILYAILCGSLPFDDENIRNLFAKIKGGIYTMPTFVSADARDLLTRMLTVDPIRRITMQEIRSHPWFLVNLRLYLGLSPEQQRERIEVVNEAVLQQVVKLGFSRDRVLYALKLYGCIGAEDNVRMKKKAQAGLTDSLRHMSIVYNLLLDKKRASEQKNKDFMMESETLEAKRQFEKKNVMSADSRTHNLIQRQAVLRSPGKGEQKRQAWQLGIHSGPNSAQTVMYEIYRTLRSLCFEWKTMNLFLVKARYPTGLCDPVTGEVVLGRDVIKIEIQVYRNADGEYVVDIQKLYGEVFLFMRLSTDFKEGLERRLSDDTQSEAASSSSAESEDDPIAGEVE